MPERHGKEIWERLAQTIRFQSTDMKTLEQIEYEYFLKHAHQPATADSTISSLYFKMCNEEYCPGCRQAQAQRLKKVNAIRGKFGG